MDHLIDEWPATARGASAAWTFSHWAGEDETGYDAEGVYRPMLEGEAVFDLTADDLESDDDD